MALTMAAQLGLAMRFRVVVDEVDLGGWASCTGLSVTFKNTLVPEGANYEYQPILPDRLDYSVVTLKRAMTKQDSAQVQQWLSRVVSQWFSSNSPSDYSARTARISLFDSQAEEIASWSLRNVYPKAWHGPDLDATGNKVAIETLELIHEGFL